MEAHESRTSDYKAPSAIFVRGLQIGLHGGCVRHIKAVQIDLLLPRWLADITNSTGRVWWEAEANKI